MKRYVVLALSAFALSGLIATPALAAKSGGGKQGKSPTPAKSITATVTIRFCDLSPGFGIT